MGPWLRAVIKQLVLGFLVLSYAFGSHYNKKYVELMNSLGVTYYDLRHSTANVRGRQTRTYNDISNRLANDHSVTKRSSFGGTNNNNTSGATNKSCCKLSCTVRRKRSLTFPIKNEIPLSATLRFLSSSGSNNNGKTFKGNDRTFIGNDRTFIGTDRTSDISDRKYSPFHRTLDRKYSSFHRTLENGELLQDHTELFEDHTGRTARSLSTDALKSVGGDLARIQSEVTQNPTENEEKTEKKEEVPSHEETSGLNTSEDEFIDNLIMQESDGLSDKKDKVDNTDILENAFHHSKIKNRITHNRVHKEVTHEMTHKIASINSTDQNDRNTPDQGKPNLLSFFKDEGEPVVNTVVNQTEDEHEHEEHDGGESKTETTTASNATVGTFEEYNNNESKSKSLKDFTPTPGVTHEVTKQVRSTVNKHNVNVNKNNANVNKNNVSVNKGNVNVNSSSNATTSPIIKSEIDEPVDHGTSMNSISIKSIVNKAVEEAVEHTTESGEIKEETQTEIGIHRDIVPIHSGHADSVIPHPNIDSVEMFLHDSNNFNPSDERMDQISGQSDQSSVQHEQIEQTNGQHDIGKNINPESAVSEENLKTSDAILKTSDVNLENIAIGEKSMDSGDYIAKTISALSGSKIVENNREGAGAVSDVLPTDTNTTESITEKRTNLDSAITDDNHILSPDTQNPTTNEEIETIELPANVKSKEAIISPFGEDYIGSDGQPLRATPRPIGDEYAGEAVDYLKKQHILSMDDSLMGPDGGFQDDEKAHIRSNYISQHKDLNKEILQLIQSYYKTGGTKHLKDIYRESKWNEANRNRIEFFNAVDKELIGAVCMDGSRPGYYLRKGFDTGADKWIIHLHGGAWCYNLQTCYKRRNTILGSTKGYSREDISKFFHGILSKNADENPNFFKWNIAVLSYCDGGLFSGNRKMFLMGKGKRFYFRGRRVLRLLMENLHRQQSLHKAEEVILSGTSAGGLALILQGDYIRKFVPKNTKVRGLADAGFFLDQKRSIHGNRMAHKQFKALYELHRPVLKKKCVDSYPKKDRYLCLFPQNTIHFVKLPLFIVNSLYDHWQLSYLEGVNCIYDNRECKTAQRDHILNFRNRMYQTLSDVKTFKNNTGVFANSCIAHGQVILDYTWARSKIENVSIADAFYEWYKNTDEENAKSVNFHADCKYPCNGSCPRSLAQACVENFKGVSNHQRGKSLNLC